MNLPSSHGTSFTERRKYPRYTIDIGIKMKIVGTDGVSTYCYGRGTDISDGGLSIYVGHNLAVGKAINLTLTLPYSNQPIACKVVVRNREGFKYGVEFRELSPSDRELLMETCRRLGVVQSL